MILSLIAAAALAPLAPAAASPGPSPLHRYEAIRRFVGKRGDALWPGLGDAPFGILLIGPDDERLYCREPLPEGFTSLGTDEVTGCAAGSRARTALPAGLLAAMPAFGPPSTIVMGNPEATGRSEADWTRTILHEHFHQWQDALPTIFDRMAALGLTGGDQTGMWMLNYAFPYADPKTQAPFARAARALAMAVDARGTPQFSARLANYLRARKALAAAVGARNWRYAELQLWKEGVARWTEIQLGRRYPDADVQASALALERKSRAWLDSHDIAGAGREFVYPYGTAEAMLLEACGSLWRRSYARELALGPLLERAARRCRRSKT